MSRLLPMLLATAALVGLGSATAGCSRSVTREDLESGALPLGFPETPAGPADVHAWWQAHADPRDASLDLDAEAPYVETAVDPASPVTRIGFLLAPTTLKPRALVLWLAAGPGAPRALARSEERLWGLSLWTTDDPRELYAPDARILVRRIEARAPLPANPRVLPLLPEDVPLKSATRTFHRDHLYALVDGKIFFKRNPAHDGTRAEPWRLFLTGVPAPHVPRAAEEAPFRAPGTIVALSADGDDLVAVDDTGFVFLCTATSDSWGSSSGWGDGWGFPGKRPLALTGRAQGARAWTITRRAEHALWFEDAIGNRQHMGPMGTSTLYVLHKNGQQLLFTDNGLPNDFSRDLCGPDDGRFIADTMSASASAVVLLDHYGRLLSRFEDYDLNGGTPNFEYTYRSDVRVDEDPTSMRTSIRPYFLPLAPWLWHAPVPLAGKARLSRLLTVLQTGAGNSARVVRIAGDDVDGRRGIYSLPIDGERWQFAADDSVVVPDDAWLDPKDLRAGATEFLRTGGEIGASTLPRGKTLRARWTGSVDFFSDARGNAALPLQATLDFNPLCPPHTLTLRIPTDAGPVDASITLHTVDLWTPAQRALPGFDGTALPLLGTLVFDDALLTDRRPAVRRVIERLRGYHHDTFGMFVLMRDDAVTVSVVDEGRARSNPVLMRFARDAGFDPPAGSTTPPGSFPLSFFVGPALDAAVDAPALLEGSADARRANVALRAELARAFVEVRRPTRELEDFLALPIRPITPALALGRVPRLPRLLKLVLDAERPAVAEAEQRWRAADARLAARIRATPAAP